MRIIDADALPTLTTELRLNNGKTKHFVGVELDDIRNAPTIDPVRHGYWKETDDPMFRACSVCGYLEWVGLWNNYCPECGTKMDGQETLSPFGKE